MKKTKESSTPKNQKQSKSGASNNVRQNDATARENDSKHTLRK